MDVFPPWKKHVVRSLRQARKYCRSCTRPAPRSPREKRPAILPSCAAQIEKITAGVSENQKRDSLSLSRFFVLV